MTILTLQGSPRKNGNTAAVLGAFEALRELRVGGINVCMLFQAKTCGVRLHSAADLPGILAVYKESEDFLSLGPVPRASMEMVSADIEHSRQAGGLFCVIEDDAEAAVGILDFVPACAPGVASLSLLMISRRHRRKGHGTAVLEGLESYLGANYQTVWIESGVQTNNAPGIRFWKNRRFEIGCAARDMGDGTAAFEMKKRLAGSPRPGALGGD